eukprot:CAMPEP_0119018186 /NCGR_PEP_ID=MMETSP1176-20130426/18787_1 /TAXON_ID=265551 /ORGANISM="Synedropsis recta cf, Strain CCMP1620" /LENGTH=59 /DNA_ID=CAMNT_0006972133 /DNA_START=92 /DNA_END=268 /DNA_ORIENTATION=-
MTITTTTKAIIFVSLAGSALAFAPLPTSSAKTTPLHMASSLNSDKPLFDPFNLYAESSA